MYVYHLPYTPRRKLCQILDENDQWEELAGNHMKYDNFTLASLRKFVLRGQSPSDQLLNLWGQQNHTVLELFVLLGRMRHYQAMLVLKEFIDVQYHVLIRHGNDDCNLVLSTIPRENFDRSQKVVVTNKLLEVSREDNESLPVIRRTIIKPLSPLPVVGVSHGLTASDISCVTESAGAIPMIPYEDLRQSTNNWDPATLLGKGGFGSVHKGTWKCTEVAIKKLEQKLDTPQSHNEQIKQSITELHCLNAYRHDNVLPLYAYSIGGPEPCLVYQYMPGGSLDRRLHSRNPTKPLTWTSRLKIAVGTACGLQYLHTIGEKPLIHGDIKSANILLDHNDMARIGDFGLAREGPQSDYTHIKVSRIHGTKPYLPNEFLRAKKFSTKVDTYSFGVVLFEMATGLVAYSDRREAKLLRDHVVQHEGEIKDLKDVKDNGELGDECFGAMIDVGRMCVNERSKMRPEMVEVFVRLKGVAQEIGCL